MTVEERYLFDLQGYMVLEDVLKADELRDLNQVLDEYNLWNESHGQGGFFDSWRSGDHRVSAGPIHRFAKPFRHWSPTLASSRISPTFSVTSSVTTTVTRCSWEKAEGLSSCTVVQCRGNPESAMRSPTDRSAPNFWSSNTRCAMWPRGTEVFAWCRAVIRAISPARRALRPLRSRGHGCGMCRKKPVRRLFLPKA